jgi:hypothetical protein
LHTFVLSTASKEWKEYTIWLLLPFFGEMMQNVPKEHQFTVYILGEKSQSKNDDRKDTARPLTRLQIC